MRRFANEDGDSEGMRSKGEGSVYRRKDGRVVGEYTDGLGRRRYVGGKDKNEVRAKLRKKLADADMTRCQMVLTEWSHIDRQMQQMGYAPLSDLA